MLPRRKSNPLLLFNIAFQFDGDCVLIDMGSGRIARMLLHDMVVISLIWPDAKLFIGTNGRPRGRPYLRLRSGNHMLVRVCAALHGIGPLAHRQLGYRDGDSLNIEPRNWKVNNPKECSGTDRTFQETHRRLWAYTQAHGINTSGDWDRHIDDALGNLKRRGTLQ